MNLKFTTLWQFVFYMIATFIKAPNVITHPRFWAEDGVVYFLQARGLTWWEALWAMPLGYLSFPANLSGLIAAALPLPYAPYGALAVSLSVQCLYFWVVVANRYFEEQRLKQAMLLAIPILVTQSFETWLNPINSQFWLTLAAALILAAPASASYANILTTLLAGLSGGVAAFLAPLFVLRAIMQRKWLWLLHAALVSIGAWVSIVLNIGRTIDFPPGLFSIYSFFQIILNNLCLTCSLNLFPLLPALLSKAFALGLLVLLGLAYACIGFCATAAGRWLAAASLLLLLLSFSAMLGKDQILHTPPYFHGRYTFAPASLFYGALLFINKGVAAKVAVLSLTFLLLNSFKFYRILPVVGMYEGQLWLESIQKFNTRQASMVYFSFPECGFNPARRFDAPIGLEYYPSAPDELAFKINKLEASSVRYVYLYRLPAQSSAWEVYDQGWKPSGLFLSGTTTYGLCYGGDTPRPTSEVRLVGDKMIFQRKILGDVSSHTYLVGYGENFAAMLANRSFVQFQGNSLIFNQSEFTAK